MQAKQDPCDDATPDNNWPERLFMLSPAMLCIAGADGFFKRVNPAFEQKLGYTAKMLLAQPFLGWVHPDDLQSTLDEVARLSTGIPAVHFENRYRHADGSYRWLLWNTTPVAHEELFYATALDITDRKQADERYRNLLDAVVDSIILMDDEGSILKINHATEALFGYAADELIGQSIEALLPGRLHDRRRQCGDGHRGNAQPPSMDSGLLDCVAIRKNGVEFPVEISLGPAEEKHAICVIRDITRRKQRERDLKESRQSLLDEQNQLRSLSTRLLLAEESERHRIARGLHDDVGQDLLGAKLGLDELLDSGAFGASESSALEVQNALDRAIDTTRKLTFELASAALYELGVGAALQSECELAQQQSGIRFEPPDQLTGQTIAMHLKIIVHRVGRELIRNVIRHSGARAARVSLALGEGALQLTVADDGRGFDVSTGCRNSGPAAGFGLFSVEQQLASVGGTLDITSSAQSGTRVLAIVALGAIEESQ